MKRSPGVATAGSRRATAFRSGTESACKRDIGSSPQVKFRPRIVMRALRSSLRHSSIVSTTRSSNFRIPSFYGGKVSRTRPSAPDQAMKVVPESTVVLTIRAVIAKECRLCGMAPCLGKIKKLGPSGSDSGGLLATCSRERDDGIWRRIASRPMSAPGGGVARLGCGRKFRPLRSVPVS
jgi:hypothetical protein